MPGHDHSLFAGKRVNNNSVDVFLTLNCPVTDDSKEGIEFYLNK